MAKPSILIEYCQNLVSRLAVHPDSHWHLTIVNLTLDTLGMEKGCKFPKITTKQASQAGVVLGTASWQARREKFTEQELSKQLSAAGKLGGRPRKVGS